jgi:hypothetical protein
LSRFRIFVRRDGVHAHLLRQRGTGQAGLCLKALPPNPLIAGVLFRTKDVEEWGSGLKRIAKECAENGVRAEFKVLKSGFLVTFHRKPAKSLSPSTGEETRDKLLVLIGRTPTITVERLAQLAGISAKGVEWQMTLLSEQRRAFRPDPLAVVLYRPQRPYRMIPSANGKRPLSLRLARIASSHRQVSVSR